jgi:hypothetical protein
MLSRFENDSKKRTQNDLSHFYAKKRSQNCWNFCSGNEKMTFCETIWLQCLIGKQHNLDRCFWTIMAMGKLFPTFEIIMTTLDKVFTHKQTHAKAVFTAHVTWHRSILSLIDRTVHLNFDIFWGSFVCFLF